MKTFKGWVICHHGQPQHFGRTKKQAWLAATDFHKCTAPECFMEEGYTCVKATVTIKEK